MKFNEKWLREYVNPPVSLEDLVKQLTFAGLEVDAIEANAAGDDYIIDVDLTPNRGDCFSLLGIARDLSVINRLEINPPKIGEVKPTHDERLEIHLANVEGCPRYLGRVITGINAKAKTPEWIAERLQAAEVKPISAVVDILNYVMLVLGQPMHAFDLDKLSGNSITVRRAKDGESLKLLTEEEVKLKADTLVIADEKGAQAIAGVIGGFDSGVTLETTRIFLESAHFNPNLIAGKARQYSLVTDAAHRFERGVDFELPRQAMEYATELLLASVGGEAGPVNEVVDKQYLPKLPEINLSLKKLVGLLSVEISQAEVVEILGGLGMEVVATEDNMLRVKVPSYRFDIRIEEDLVEEVARIIGYDKIPVTQFSLSGAKSQLSSASSLSERNLKYYFKDIGYHEVINYSFIDEKQFKLFNPELEAIHLSNPISSEMAVMRASFWPSLLANYQYNLRRQQPDMRLFEIGRIYRRESELLEQPFIVSGLVAGGAYPEQWGEAQREVDFYDVKGDLERLFALTGEAGAFQFVAAKHAGLHPGQCAAIQYRGETVGYLGKLNPAVAQTLSIKKSVYLFELLRSSIEELRLPVYQNISKYPSVRRDFAILIKENLEVGEVLSSIAQIAGKLLVDMIVFDVFTGIGIPQGLKSIALGLTFQHPSRTLGDEEVVEVSDRIMSMLRDKYGAELRD